MSVIAIFRQLSTSALQQASQGDSQPKTRNFIYRSFGTSSKGFHSEAKYISLYFSND